MQSGKQKRHVNKRNWVFLYRLNEHVCFTNMPALLKSHFETRYEK